MRRTAGAAPTSTDRREQRAAWCEDRKRWANRTAETPAPSTAKDPFDLITSGRSEPALPF